ncbi:DUF485 domain-containing protein [Streptomyces sp. NPDC005012]|uniref:DUF485 domain-containing protein n=1 Tax=Streptomyces sp. NPDC005012 TaxID=3154558 RepID=UPI00339EEEF8
MSYDPFPSYPAPPPQPPPPAGPFPAYAEETPVYGVRQYPAGLDAFPADPGEPFPSPVPGRRQPSAPPARQARELAGLRDAYRRQRRVAGVTVLGFFALYILLTVYAPGLVGWRVAGGLNLGLLLALLQLPVTVVVLLVHEHTAQSSVDPLVERVRGQAAEDAR